jgi:AraC-like DNA-binding protein
MVVLYVHEGRVIYLDHKPAAPLNRSIRTLWYAAVPPLDHAHERILPSGCVQVILHLEHDFLHDCPEGEAERRLPPALVVGARSIYEIINTVDMASLIGIVFEPGGFGPFVGDAVDLFSNQSVCLEDVWGTAARSLRDRLRETPSPRGKIAALEEFLRIRFAGCVARRNTTRMSTIEFAVKTIGRTPSVATVRELARSTGWSERRFSQVFREEVGFSPKVWSRIQRFQRALRQLHAGGDLPWAELALECGYYDQSHFANEFKAFSGIDATSYCAARTVWTNQIAVS